MAKASIRSLDYTDIEQAVGPRAFSRGLAYHSAQRVKQIEISPDGSALAALVNGSAAWPYRVHAVVEADGLGGNTIRGICSCPVGNNCKHVAAALCEAISPRTGAGGESGASGTPDRTPESREVSNWLQDFDRAFEPPKAEVGESATRYVQERLIYVLNHPQPYNRACPMLALKTARLLKSGGYGKLGNFNGSLAAKFLTAEDLLILRWLYATHQSHVVNLVLSGAEAGRIYERIIGTGRCHWRDKETPPLRFAEPREVSFAWQISADGNQRIRGFGDHVDAVFAFEALYYLDIEHHQTGPILTDLPVSVVASLLRAPPITPEHAQVVKERVSGKLAGHPLSRPMVFDKFQTRLCKPVPCLRLFQRTFPIEVTYRYMFQGRPEKEVLLARLSFDYDGMAIFADDKRHTLSIVDANTVTRIPRHTETERAAIDTLSSWRLQPVEDFNCYHRSAADPLDTDFAATPEGDSDWFQFVTEGIEQLRCAGWKIEVDEDFPFRVVDNAKWYVDIDDGNTNWFDLELGVDIDGERISLLPYLLSIIQQLSHGARSTALSADGHPLYARLPGGRLLPIPVERMQPILNTLVDLFDPQANPNTPLKLPTARAQTLAELNESFGEDVMWRGGAKLRELGDRLREFAGIAEVPPPPGLQAELRPYQRLGLSWLQFLREYNFGGILADDMGLGKTLQALAHLLVEKISGRMTKPSLVVTPTSLVHNWLREAQRFAPALRVLPLQGAVRKRFTGKLCDYDVVLTTYPLITRDRELLTQQAYHLLILDEAQNVKNPRAKASGALRELTAEHRLCLTGTPLENHLGELWSLFDFLMPNLLGDERQFKRVFRTPIEKDGDDQRRDALRRRIAPFLLRRTKQQVAWDLPPKSEILRTVELDGEQRDMYETIRLAMHKKVRDAIRKQGLARSHIVILEALLKLRQVCCDPRLVKNQTSRKVPQSAKLELLMDMVPELVSEGRSILLFSQFTEMLALIEAELQRNELDYVKLTGETRDRATPIDQFQSGKVPIFLISLKAGGTGLNLTAADTVIHYDPWWNPAVEAQATDRAHRIGQDKPVFVYKLITAGTVEEKIVELQARKKELADGVLEEDLAGRSNLTATDLEALFEPLS